MSAPDDPKVLAFKTKRGEAKARHEAEGGWRARVIRSQTTDNPLDLIENVRLVLLGDPCFAGLLHYDEMRRRAVVGSLPWHSTNRLRDWVDRDDLDLAAWCQRHGLMAKPATCAAAVQSVAHAHAIHPLRARLDGLEWDGDERLSTWLATYLGVEPSDYSQAIGRAWMISGVARAFEPGCKADHALILEGGQGKLKSTLAAILALERGWFTDEIADLGSKDSAQDLQGKWIIEICELASMRKALIEKVKAFLSRSIDHYRPSYARHSQDFPRGCIFIGSTNDGQYLQDATGNRRFWPIKVGVIDLAALRQDIEALWAEAVHAYREGEHWWLDAAAETIAADQQEERRQVDPWEELALEAAEKIIAGVEVRIPTVPPTFETVSGKVTTNKVLQVLGVPIERRSRKEETRVGTVLTAAGWTRNSARHSKPRYWYTPPDGEVGTG